MKTKSSLFICGTTLLPLLSADIFFFLALGNRMINNNHQIFLPSYQDFLLNKHFCAQTRNRISSHGLEFFFSKSG